MILELKDITTAERQQYLQAAIAPRPIALASTINKKGIVNLAPFSFFNLFSADPPILIFSPALRVRDGSRKDTLDNIVQIPEVVINIVDFEILHRVNQCSADYHEDVDELTMVGFHAVQSIRVKPPRVLESKIQLECRVNEIKPMGTKGGAGTLMICEVLIMHIDNSILGMDQKIDQKKIHHVARLGGEYYCGVNEDNLFQLAKPKNP